MKFTAVIVAAFAAMATAAPSEAAKQDLYLSGDAPAAPAPPAPPAAPPAASSGAASGNKCSQCAAYCGDPSNGAAISAACLIVKCGIQCLVG